MRKAWTLTALRLGEDRAASFGIDVRRLRLGTLLRVSVLSALAVSFVGTIGFVGLIAPHIARTVFGEDHRFYLPGSMLIGALMLSLASIASKIIVPGVLIPVGIVTALVGIPLFLGIVVRSQGATQCTACRFTVSACNTASARCSNRSMPARCRAARSPRCSVRTAAASRRCCARWRASRARMPVN
jgi:hypothetical protein